MLAFTFVASPESEAAGGREGGHVPGGGVVGLGGGATGRSHRGQPAGGVVGKLHRLKAAHLARHTAAARVQGVLQHATLGICCSHCVIQFPDEAAVLLAICYCEEAACLRKCFIYQSNLHENVKEGQ